MRIHNFQLAPPFSILGVNQTRTVQEPKLCSDCPLISFLPIIMAERVSYTTQRETLTSHKICRLLRAFAKDHHITFNECLYFLKTETMERYVRNRR